MACITRTVSELPDTMVDTSTLSISFDNQGMVNLQVVILTKSREPITSFDFSFAFNGNDFSGFIDSDIQRRLEGTDYWEHAIVSRGMVC